jgi:hypothetical protein
VITIARLNELSEYGARAIELEEIVDREIMSTIGQVGRGFTTVRIQMPKESDYEAAKILLERYRAGGWQGSIDIYDGRVGKPDEIVLELRKP